MSGNSIAAIVGAETPVIQKLMIQAAERWRSEGFKVCGIVEDVSIGATRACGNSVLRNIETGETFEMFLKEAPAHTSCILDEYGVLNACANVIDSIRFADIVILSKFGKAEAVGSGLFDAFESAASLGKPMLTSVAPKFHYFWNRFTPKSIFISPDRAQIEQWKARLVETPAPLCA